MDTKATGEESVAATQHDCPATFLFPLLLDPRRVPPPPPSRFPQSGINPEGGGGAATTTTVTLGVYFVRLSVILMRYIIRKATKKKY